LVAGFVVTALVTHIYKVATSKKLRRARLVLGLVITFWRVYYSRIYQATLAHSVSLTILPWVGAVCTHDGFAPTGAETASSA